MNEFKSLESLVLGGSYLVGRPRRLYDTTSLTLGSRWCRQWFSNIILLNKHESATVDRRSRLSSSVVMPHRLAFLNTALIRSTSLFRMNP